MWVDSAEISDWYYKYVDDVHNYLVYFMGTTDVEDLVQDTFIKALRGLNSFKRTANPKTWLFSIARNTAINHIRAKKKTTSADQLDYIPNRQTLEDEMAEQETHRIILDRINDMKDDYREVVLHRVVIGLSIAETAETLGWSEAKVKTTQRRALIKLRESLTEGGEACDFI